MNAIMLLTGFLIVLLFVAPAFMAAAIARNKWGFAIVGLVLILVGMVALCQIAIGRTNEVIATKTAKVMLNDNNAPMYDVVGSSGDSDDNGDSTNTATYKVYLQSGKSKVVSPEIIHIKKSFTPYLKIQKKQMVTYVYGIKIIGEKYTDSTLYVNDKK